VRRRNPHLRPSRKPSERERSFSAHLLGELSLYAHRRLDGEPDPRPLPEPETAEAALDFLFEALSGLFMGTRLEDDPLDRLWSLVNLLNGKADRNSRTLDGNEAAQRRPLGDQCGSVVRSVELEPHRSRAHTSGTP